MVYGAMSCLVGLFVVWGQPVCKITTFLVTLGLEGIIQTQEVVPDRISMNENDVPIIRNELPFFF